MKPLCCFAALMLTLAVALPGLTDDKTDDSLKEGFVPIFDGKTLKGWKADDEAKKHWQPKDGKLICDGMRAPASPVLHGTDSVCGIRHALFRGALPDAAPALRAPQGAPRPPVRDTPCLALRRRGWRG